MFRLAELTLGKWMFHVFKSKNIQITLLHIPRGTRNRKSIADCVVTVAFRFRQVFQPHTGLQSKKYRSIFVKIALARTFCEFCS